jgi:hypothetical protein
MEGITVTNLAVLTTSPWLGEDDDYITPVSLALSINPTVNAEIK